MSSTARGEFVDNFGITVVTGLVGGTLAFGFTADLGSAVGVALCLGPPEASASSSSSLHHSRGKLQHCR